MVIQLCEYIKNHKWIYYKSVNLWIWILFQESCYQKQKNKPDEPDGSQGPLPPWPAWILSSISYKIGKI